MTLILSAWSWFTGSKVGRILGAVLLGALFLIGLRAKWKGEGKAEERQKMREADRLQAKETRDEVDSALDDARDVPVLERLRRQGQLRSGDNG